MARLERLVAGYGGFLILAGVLGWASTGFSDKGKTAILSGLVTGLVMLGLLGAFRIAPEGLRRPVTWAMLAFTSLFAGTFIWRGLMAWQAVLQGEPKVATAILLTTMAVTSLVVAVELWRRRPAVVPAPRPGPAPAATLPGDSA